MKGLLAVSLVLILGCNPRSPLIRGFPEGQLTIDSGQGARVSIRVEIATTPRQQATGLMGIDTIAADVGMVFLFDEPTQHPFFMENTLFELDIVFWDEKMRIIDTLTMTPCTEDPCTLYSPSEPYVGALEVRTGFLSHNGIIIGDTVTLERGQG